MTPDLCREGVPKIEQPVTSMQRYPNMSAEGNHRQVQSDHYLQLEWPLAQAETDCMEQKAERSVLKLVHQGQD